MSLPTPDRRSGPFLLVLAAVLSVGTFAQSQTLTDPNFTQSSYVFVASEITGMGWAPDGSNRLFVTRKGGQVRIVKDGVLLATPFATETVFTNSECGLIGMAFDPGFATNGYVYFFITVSGSEQQIVRYTAAGDVGTNRIVIVSGLPTLGANHDGGAIGFGRDGMLYWAIGDQGNFTGTNDNLTSLAAKVGRALPDGSVPADNPFVDGAGPNHDSIWARGFRNPFTMTFRPETDDLWLNVVGTSYEQTFVVRRGDHGGYHNYENNQPAGFLRPVIAYLTSSTTGQSRTISGASRSSGVATFTTTSSDHGFPVGMKVTIAGAGDSSFNGDAYVTAVPSLNTFQIAQPGPNATTSGGTATSLMIGRAIGGGTFFESTSVPTSYRGDFFFPDYITGRIVRADIGPSGLVGAVDIFATGAGSAIDMEVGPDGNLYVATHSGGIVRVVFTATSQGLVLSRRFLRTSEGSAAVFNVRLAMAPVADVTVTVNRSLGSSSLSVADGETLTFTPANWSVPQTVRIASSMDGSAIDQEAFFTVSSAGLTSETVTVRATATSYTVLPSVPAGFGAQALSASLIGVSWNVVGGATVYDVERAAPGGTFQPLVTVEANFHNDASVSPNTAYLYRVRARNPAGASAFSAGDLAVSVVFSDDPLVSQQTPIRAAHLTQLRTATDAVRSLASLATGSWTDEPVVAGVTPVRKIHVEELRSRLSAALTALGLSSPTLTDPVLTTSTPVKAVHFQELRNAME